MGYIVLQGGAEFQGQMRHVDRAALDLAGGHDQRVGIVSTAAVPDQNQQRAADKGLRWFTGLGATDVRDLRLWDRGAAQAPWTLQALSAVKLLFILGGFPGYLAQTLVGSAAWGAMVARIDEDPSWVLAGSSAGAMVLCDTFFDPVRERLVPGLGLLPGICVIPHCRTVGDHWRQMLMPAAPHLIFVCIDEQTGVITDAQRTHWQVYGGGSVEIWQADRSQVYQAGDTIELPLAKKAHDHRPS